ncbi:MAG: iron uptake porin [Cyanobacteria bacterium J06636_16]
MIILGPVAPPIEVSTEQPAIVQRLASQNHSARLYGPLVHELEAPLTAQTPQLNPRPLWNRVEDLEEAVSELETQQVSPVLEFSGEAIFGISGAAGRDVDAPTLFQSSIELAFEASFTGEDQLEIAIESGSAPEFEFNDVITPEGQLDFTTDTDNGVFELSELSYEFPLGDRTTVLIAATGDSIEDFNPIVGDGNKGALSEFGAENPIHSLLEDYGIQFNYELTDALELGIGYFADNANDPETGLFGGNYGAFAQLAFEPNDDLLLGLSYVHTDNDTSLETDTGSFRSQIDLDRPVVGNSYGIAGSWAPSEAFAVGGWVGYTNARVLNLGDAYVLNYALTLAFPDLGQEDNLLGIILGQEPRLIGTSGFTIDGRREDPDTSFHIEAFYSHQVNEYLSITPGIIWLTAPDHNADNADIVLFTVRTAFEF